jgi:ferric-dicitrate binding protein FerR (iron transport regulator)
MSEHDTDNRDRGERQIQDALRALPEVQADAEFRQRLKADFVSGAILEREPAKGRSTRLQRHPWLWASLSAAAVILVSLLVFSHGPAWTLHGVTGEGQVVVNGQQFSAQDIDELNRLLGARVDLEVPDGVVLDVICPEVLLLEIAPNTHVVIPANPGRFWGRTLTSRVDKGEIRFKTGPEFSGYRFLVLTSEGRTEIAGTTVSVYKGDDFTCVCVLSGTARIGQQEATMEDIPAGMRKVMFADGRAPLITKIAAEHEEGLVQFEARNQAAF